MNGSQNIVCIDNTKASYITVGRLYTTIPDKCHGGRIYISDMDCPVFQRNTGGGNYNEKFFKKLTELSLEELSNVAKSLIGLTLLQPGRGKKHTITSWGISNDVEANSHSVRNDAKTNDISVFLRFGSSASVPVRDLCGYRVVYPTLTETVVLNSDYDAIVSKTHIEVGCQTFPIDILDKLNAARDRLN